MVINMNDNKLLLIVNPCSGKAKMKPNLLKVVQTFSDEGWQVTVYPTKAPTDATLYTSTLKDGEFNLIVVCGGDGTLNEVITGVMQSKINCKIGYIPAGTLNEWSTGLKISKVIPRAASDILTGKEITLDIGKFGDKYFTYTASFGAFTSASYATPQKIKNLLGHTAYILEGAKSLASIRSTHLKIEADDRVVEGDFLFGAVSNSFSVGGIVKYNNKLVTLNDGLFEVFLIRKPKNIIKVQPLIDGILKKKFDREGMEFFHTKNLTVYSEKEVDWTLDGEHATASGELKIGNLQNAIKFIVPNIENKPKKK